MDARDEILAVLRGDALRDMRVVAALLDEIAPGELNKFDPRQARDRKGRWVDLFDGDDDEKEDDGRGPREPSLASQMARSTALAAAPALIGGAASAFGGQIGQIGAQALAARIAQRGIQAAAAAAGG